MDVTVSLAEAPAVKVRTMFVVHIMQLVPHTSYGKSETRKYVPDHLYTHTHTHTHTASCNVVFYGDLTPFLSCL